MSMVPTQDYARPPGFSFGRLIPRLLLGLSVVALPDVAPAGIFDFLKRDRDDDVEIIETHHASNCRCRPRCNHPNSTQKQQVTPQTTYRPTPRPTPQPTPQHYSATQPVLPHAAPPVAPFTTHTVPPVPTLRSAPPAPPVATRLPPTRYATKPAPGFIYQSQPTHRTTPPVIYQREMVVNHVPVTTWQTQWVDQGTYRMVWVSRPTLRQVPRTSYRPVLGYRVVPYQRMAPTTAGAPTPTTTLPGTPPATGGRVPNPLEAQPVKAQRSASRTLKPTTAHRVWQARGRLGR